MEFCVSGNKDLTQGSGPSITLYLRKNKNGTVDLMGDSFILGSFKDGKFLLVDDGFEYSGIKLDESITI